MMGQMFMPRTGKVMQASEGLKHSAMTKKAFVFPTSFAQQRLWFLDQLEPGTGFYNVPQAFRIGGALDIDVLHRTLEAIVARHESLRTTFSTVDENPVQVIAEHSSVELPVVDLRDLDANECEVEVHRLSIEEGQRPFDLVQGPLFRARLLKLGDEDHVLLLTMHHIICDGWSFGVFFRELGALYEALTAGKRSPLPELPIQYADYAIWQREWLQGEVLEEQLSYWRKQLTGAPAVMALPTDRIRPAVQTHRGKRQTLALSKELSEALKALSRQEDVTLFMMLLAAFQTLLCRHSGRDDIVVGTDVANRNRIEIEELIGFFLNHLVMRTDLSGDPSFRELLKRVRDVALGAYAHQDIPFDKVVEAVKPERDMSYTPLFQILFVLQNASRQVFKLSGMTISLMKIDSGMAKFDLALFMNETKSGLTGTWVYNPDLFEESTITRLSGHFKTLLRSIVAHPDARLSALDMLTETEKEQQNLEKRERKEAKLKRLKNLEPKAVDLSPEKFVKTGYLRSGETLPLMIQPRMKDISLAEWASNNRSFIETELSKHGAILFRGFNVETVSAFEQFAQALCSELFGEYGDLPREGVSGKVYGSTPYPSDQTILFHNESSHMHRWPMKIWFYCVRAAEQGGETPIVDCRRVYELIEPKLRERFAQTGLMYVRNYTDGLDVDWRSFFHTTDRSVVEDYCRKVGMDFEWKNGDGLRTRQLCPAVAKHPKTGEMVFFNQIQLHHVSCLEPAVRESIVSMFRQEDLPRHVYYGDGSPIEDSVMEQILEIYRKATVSFPWQEGDIIMLDNMLAAHGRNPFVGERKIVVTLGEMINKEDV